MPRIRKANNRRPAAEAGISIIELLISSAILLIVMIGILPLFHRSVVSNTSARGTSELVNFGQTTVEDVARHNFDSALLTLGAGEEKVVDEYFDEQSHTWVAGAAPNNETTRTLTVRQFGIGALDDGIITDDDALDASAPPEAVHIKQVTVELSGRRKALKLPHQTLDLTLIKSN